MEWKDLKEGMECEVRPFNDKSFEEGGWQKTYLKHNPGFYIPNGGIYNMRPYWYAYYKVPTRTFSLSGEGEIIEDRYHYTEIVISDLKQIRING